MKMNAFMAFVADRQMTKLEKPLAEKFKKPEDPLFSFDIPYVENGEERQCFDIFLAKLENRKGVLLIDIHGGAYIHGWRRNNFYFGGYFREAGYDVVCADYRFVGRKNGASVLTEIQDLAALLNYLKAHEEELGIKEDSWALTGDSAGGHFALFLTEALCNEELKKKWGIDANLPKPKCVLINCPVYDFTGMVDTSFTKGGLIRTLGKVALDKEFVRSIDPRENLVHLDCPVFLSSCTNDFLQMHYRALEEDCQKQGKEHEKIFIETEDKNVGHVHNVVNLEYPESKQVNEAMVAFLSAKA